MDHHAEHDLSHRQEREIKKEQYKKETHMQTEPKMTLSAVHPAWYIVVAVITCGIAVIIWTCYS
jgi:hypothetical protein